MERLDKCPFCGNRAEFVTGASVFAPHKIQCMTCGANSASYVSKDNAIAAWNRRPATENNPLTLDELQQMDGEDKK